MGKKVYVGDGHYCYTDNCTRHDGSEAGQHILRANEAAKAGNVSDYLKYKDLAKEAEKSTGEKPKTRLQGMSFGEPEVAKPAAPSPATSGRFKHMNMGSRVRKPRQADPARDARVKAHLNMISNDLKGYQSDDKNRTGQTMVAFHKEIGFPKYFKAPTHSVPVTYSPHADAARLDDRYDYIERVDSIDFSKVDLIEIKYNQSNGRVERMLVRDDSGPHSISYVVAPGARSWHVVTTWINESGDTHQTLNRSRYADPSKRQQLAAAA